MSDNSFQTINSIMDGNTSLPMKQQWLLLEFENATPDRKRELFGALLGWAVTNLSAKQNGAA